VGVWGVLIQLSVSVYQVFANADAVAGEQLAKSKVVLLVFLFNADAGSDI
jgi:hypothetical protein